MAGRGRAWPSLNICVVRTQAPTSVRNMEVAKTVLSVFVSVETKSMVRRSIDRARRSAAMLHCEKLNAFLFFRDIDSSSGVVYVPSALAGADVAWGKHGDPLGEGSAFTRNAHVAQADGHAQVRYDTQ